MTFHLTELMAVQAKTMAVMVCAGVAVESLWQLKEWGKARSKVFRRKSAIIVMEIHFWIGAAAIISAFLYYSNFGKISFVAAVSFLIGLLLWKKIVRGIIKPNDFKSVEPWQENDEAKNSKTTVASLISRTPEKSDWQGDRQSGKRKKRS